MQDNNNLYASCRIALAAYLHDLGKFSQRAQIPVDKKKLDLHKQQYCPQHPQGGWWSHVHAAYTALSFDLIEKHLPDIVGEEVSPFASWSDPHVDDSLINAAARHHKPETALQWIVATADRVASGFERETFDSYNIASDEQTTHNKNFYQARLLSLFEQIHIESKAKQTLEYRYPLRPMSVQNLYPQLAKACEPDNNEQAIGEYKQLWDEFITHLEKIPRSHKRLDIWLDHFDSLWQCFTQAIPSATAGKTKPEVSLYDHSRATAALAVALWQYHDQNQTDKAQLVKQLSYYQDWDEDKFLLIQGDLFGIQNFIFSEGSQTNKQAAKILRGRSFYVSLLSELAALKILETLELPPVSQIINAAGKFLIVAPNTTQTIQKLEKIRAELNQWFLQQTYGQSGIGIAWQAASCNDFVSKKDQQQGFARVVSQLFQKLEQEKLQRFHLCQQAAPKAVFEDYLDSFDNTLGTCAWNHHYPAQKQGDNGLPITLLSSDQIHIGENLSKYQRIFISQQPLYENRQSLQLDIFGYRVNFTRDELSSGKFGEQIKNNNLRRAWDFSLPRDQAQILFNGYARRNINTYVTGFSKDDLAQYDYKYTNLEQEDKNNFQLGDSKPFTHLACEDRRPSRKDALKWQGIHALCTLKGDVDNLGRIFEQGLRQPSFAKMAALSRQLNNFFALALADLCRREFPQTYTVFAGGDDFFLIGPWLSQQQLARRMAEKFAAYVANNPDIHFSAGLLISKADIPVPTLAEQAEQALEQAKAYQPAGQASAVKNAVCIYNRTMDWVRYEQLHRQTGVIRELSQRYAPGTAYFYSLIALSQMAQEAQLDPVKAIWHARFRYRTARLCKDNLRLSGDKLQRALMEFGDLLAQKGIKVFAGDYQVALFNHLYQLRD